MRKKPDWIPDWHNESEYPDPETTTPQQWAWEFLRRSPLYQGDYKEFEDKIEPDILWQVKKRLITTETAQTFIQCLKKNGKDCLMPKMKLPNSHVAGGSTNKPEYKLWLPWFLGCDSNDNADSLDGFVENWDNTIPEIIEPAFFRRIRDDYRLCHVHNPAKDTAPMFRGVSYNPTVPLAHKYSTLTPHYLCPETEDEIAFMVNLKNPIQEQIDFIKGLCMHLKVKTGSRESRHKGFEWKRQLRLLDADAYGPSTARTDLAEEWDCSPSNLTHKSLIAKKNRDEGYKQIALLENSLVSDPKQVAASIKVERAISKLNLNFDIDETSDRRRNANIIKQESLNRLRADSKK